MSVTFYPPAERAFTRNPIFVGMESDRFDGVDPPFSPNQPNLYASLDVYEKIGADLILLGPCVSPYSSQDKRTDFDIANLFPKRVALPTAASIGISGGDPYSGVASGICMKYVMKYTDKFGEPPVADELITSDEYLAIYGGVPEDSIQNINWAGSIIPLHTYLYKRNDAFIFRKPVAPHQPDWLYFVSVFEGNIIVKVRIEYNDGTYTLYDSHTIAVVENTAYWTQCGHDQLKIPAHIEDDKVVAGYQVSFIREDTEQNAYTAFFVIDDICPSWERFLLMHNGIGGYESVRMKGVGRHGHRVSREKYRKTKWKDFNVQTGTIGQTRVPGSPTINVHTGHYPHYYLEHLRQMLHAHIWMIDLDLAEVGSYRFLRYMCETDSIDLYTDEPAPDGFALTLSKAWEDDGFNIF